MLRLHPDKRAKASELVHHQWLEGVIVQGEIDLIRRAEEEELRRRVEAEERGKGRERGSRERERGRDRDRERERDSTRERELVEVVGPEGRAILARAEERHYLETQMDADALKPVEDAPTSSSSYSYTEQQQQQQQQAPQPPHLGHAPTGHTYSSTSHHTYTSPTSGPASGPVIPGLAHGHGHGHAKHGSGTSVKEILASGAGILKPAPAGGRWSQAQGQGVSGGGTGGGTGAAGVEQKGSKKKRG